MNTNLENMKSQTFGVEIEMNNISRRDASRVISEYFGTRYENTSYIDGYSAWSTYDLQGRKWKFVKDVSIHGIESEQCELVTPILHYEDIETLQEVVRRLRNAGAKSDATRGCGIHIHVGGDGHTPKTIKNLANMMASHEALLIKALKIDRSRVSSYCRMVEPRFIEALNENTPKDMAGLEDMWYVSTRNNFDREAHYNNSRYHMLNLHSLFHGHGTIEFRLFQFDTPKLGRDGRYHGGIHAGQLKSYIQLCLAMSNRAKEMTRASHKVTKYYESNPLNAMLSWLLRLGMDYNSEEFKTSGIIFTRNLTKKALREIA